MFLPLRNDSSSPLHISLLVSFLLGLPWVAQTVKRLAYNAGDLGLIPGLGRPSGEGNGNPLQYFCLENSMDRGTWQGLQSMGVTKSWTRLSMHWLLFFSSFMNILLYVKSVSGFLSVYAQQWDCRSEERLNSSHAT